MKSSSGSLAKTCREAEPGSPIFGLGSHKITRLLGSTGCAKDGVRRKSWIISKEWVTPVKARGFRDGQALAVVDRCG